MRHHAGYLRREVVGYQLAALALGVPGEAQVSGKPHAPNRARPAARPRSNLSATVGVGQVVLALVRPFTT